MTSAKDGFRELVQCLKDCPTLDPTINPKLLCETWSAFRRLDPQQGDEVTPAMLVALILHDEESFAELLTEAQLAQLHLVAGQAMQQYELAIKPKNQVGQLLATTIKENEKV
jgi:hypothetical protein